MSESAGKTFRGLQEAYASIYANKSENLTEDTVVSEVQEEQEFEINEEALYESAIGYLIHFGYASDEKKAAAMIPHMSEQWMTEFLIHDILAENFVIAVNTLLEEGKDLSGYTWDELYEGYCSNAAENLNEVALALPAVWTGLTGLVGGAAHLLKGMNRPKPATTGPSTWDYGQSGTSTYKPKPAPVVAKPKPAPVVAKPKPAPVVKSQSVDLDNPSSTPYPRTSTATARVTSGSTATPAPGPGGGDGGDNGDNKPPKDKGPNWFQRRWAEVKQGIKRGQVQRDASREARRAARQASGKPSPTEKITKVATDVLRGTLPYGLGVLGADLGTGGLTQGLGQGASSQFVRDVIKLGSQGQKLGPAYKDLKQTVKGSVSPEQEKPEKPLVLPDGWEIGPNGKPRRKPN